MTSSTLSRSTITPEQRFGLERLLHPAGMHEAASNCRRYADDLLPADVAQRLVRQVMAAPHPDGFAFNVEWGGKAFVSYAERSKRFLGRFLQEYFGILEPSYLDANGLDGVIEGVRGVGRKLEADIAAGMSDPGFIRNKEIVDYMREDFLGSEAEREILRAVKFVFGTYREDLLVGQLKAKAERLEALEGIGKHLATSYLLQSRPESDFDQDARPIDVQKLLAADPFEMANYAHRDMKVYRSVMNALPVRRNHAMPVVETPVAEELVLDVAVLSPQDSAQREVMAAVTASKNGFPFTDGMYQRAEGMVSYVLSKLPHRANAWRRSWSRFRMCDVSERRPTEGAFDVFCAKQERKADEGMVSGNAGLKWDYGASLKGE